MNKKEKKEFITWNEFLQFIKDSHSNHTSEYCEKELNIGSCAIYDSIQSNDSDYELIAVAMDTDDSIIESFVSYSMISNKKEGK